MVQGVLAICQIQGCPKPNVSLGSVPKPGQKKRISEYILYTTAALYHNAFFQQPVPSPTTWLSITKQSGTPTLIPEQGRLRWRPRSRRRWPWPKGEYDCCCPLIQSFSTRYLNTSCNIHGSWEAVQCSRTDYGFKEEQIVTHICWQAAHLLGIYKLD